MAITTNIRTSETLIKQSFYENQLSVSVTVLKTFHQHQTWHVLHVHVLNRGRRRSRKRTSTCTVCSEFDSLVGIEIDGKTKKDDWLVHFLSCQWPTIWDGRIQPEESPYLGLYVTYDSMSQASRQREKNQQEKKKPPKTRLGYSRPRDVLAHSAGAGASLGCGSSRRQHTQDNPRVCVPFFFLFRWPLTHPAWEHMKKKTHRFLLLLYWVTLTRRVTRRLFKLVSIT